jgi:tetratricopeptide (TPR) repeat protein
MERAVETYREAIEEAPYDELKAQLHQSLARLYKSQSRPQEAAAEYEAVIELGPEGPAADEARREIAELTVQPLTGTSSAESSAP